MDVETLIEEVRKFPVLYDQNNEKYRNTEFKDKIWKKIATTLKAKGGADECRKRWASLRDQLRKTIHKRKTASGQAAARNRKYKFEDLLEFLIPHLSERETTSDVPYSEETKELDEIDYDTVIQKENFIAIPTKKRNREDELESQEYKLEGLDSQSSPISKAALSETTMKKDVVKPGPLMKRKIIREANDQESGTSQLMAYILAQKEAENERKRSLIEITKKHPVDAFLAGIAPSLKLLSPILLNQAKSSIFSIVQDYEMKQLMDNPGQYVGHEIPSNSPWSSPASSP